MCIEDYDVDYERSSSNSPFSPISSFPRVVRISDLAMRLVT